MKIAIILLFSLTANITAAQKSIENWGGKTEKNRLFDQELYYSPEALEKLYGGKVELSFDLNNQGLAQNIEITKSVSKDVDSEAKRILRLMLWDKKDTTISTTEITESISFRFNPLKYSSICKSRGYELSRPDPDFVFMYYLENELDEVPRFYGEEGSFEKYLKKNFSYPFEAAKTKAEGIVEIKFVIEPSGRITNVKVQQSLEANCDLHAIALILGSQWKCGKKNGIPVRTVMSRKLQFSIGTESGKLPHLEKY